MQSIEEIAGMLELMDHPAFCVTDGIISAVNQAAGARLISPGEPVLPLLASGQNEYPQFHGGTMELTLDLCGEICAATVTRIGGRDVFRLMPKAFPMQSLALAAQELRRPLTELMTACQELFPDLPEDADPRRREQAARMNRELYRMLRIVGNMSFQPVPRMEMRDVTAVLGELFESAAHYCELAQRKLVFSNYPAPIYSYLDSDLLSRAVHNLLSNAIRHTTPGGTISARLTRSGNTMLLAIQDSGDGSEKQVSAAFHHFHREPGLGSAGGLGLGLSIVNAVAQAHGGTLLLDQPRGAGLKAVVSLPICQDGARFRSPALPIDYTGERSRELIELSDVLPYELYAPGTE